MKIVVITGSAHKNGTTAHLAGQFIRGAEEAGHEVFRFDAAFKDVHPCLGCDTCRSGDGGCVFKDGMEELNPRLLAADAVVFASPIYYFDVNAQIKTVMDRFYANNYALKGADKKAALLLACGDAEADACGGAIESFRLMTGYLRWKNAGIVAAPGCNTLDDLLKTDFPRQAHELGRTI